MEDISKVLLKIGGFGFLAYSVIKIAEYAPYVVGKSSEYAPVDVLAILLGSGFFPLLFAYLLIRRTDSICRFLRCPSVDRLALPEEAERIGIALIGTFLLFRSASDLAFHLATLWKAHQIQVAGMASTNITLITPQEHGFIVATIVELLVAAYFVLGAGNFVAFLKKLRG